MVETTKTKALTLHIHKQTQTIRITHAFSVLTFSKNIPLKIAIIPKDEYHATSLREGLLTGDGRVGYMDLMTWDWSYCIPFHSCCTERANNMAQPR